MLFDLRSGKRRRVVQVVFGGLALLFAISFVGFGIGGDVSGGLFDAIGLGGDDSSSTPQYEEQIEKAESTLETDPKNERALLDLLKYHYLSATSTEDGIQSDPATGLVSVSDDAQSQLEDAIDAWNRYLEAKPKEVSVDAAVNAFQAQDLLFRAALSSGDASAALDAAEGAAEAQRFVAERRDTASDYGALANYLYYAGRTKEGDAAAARAVQASEPASREQVRKAMNAAAEQGAALNKQIEKAIKQGGGQSGSSIQNPFGGIGGGSGTTTPTP
jgi:hypothetical protein